jgi:hypothetical protein
MKVSEKMENLRFADIFLKFVRKCEAGNGRNYYHFHDDDNLRSFEKFHCNNFLGMKILER